MKFVISMIVSLLFFLSAQESNQLILHQAHSHNDYEHNKPLITALDHGFKSVEVDILLWNGKLYVGHDHIDIIKGQMLDKLYLEPLYSLFTKNNGYIYNNEAPLILLVDVKTSAEETFQRLDIVLKDYRDMLTKFDNGHLVNGAVTIILSGNRPDIDLIFNTDTRYVFIDGRLENVGKNIDNNVMPLISIDWADEFDWNGKGDFPESELNNLKSITNKVHSEGKMLRFWGSPDNVEAWELLDQIGVDLINTDKIKMFYEHFAEDLKNN